MKKWIAVFALICLLIYALLEEEGLTLETNDGRKTYPMEDEAGSGGRLRRTVSDAIKRYSADELDFDTDLKVILLS